MRDHYFYTIVMESVRDDIDFNGLITELGRHPDIYIHTPPPPARSDMGLGSTPYIYLFTFHTSCERILGKDEFVDMCEEAIPDGLRFLTYTWRPVIGRDMTDSEREAWRKHMDLYGR